MWRVSIFSDTIRVMIYSITGKLAKYGGEYAVIDVGGVGYKVMVPPSFREKDLLHSGESLTLFCSFSLRQDGTATLYGFLHERELEFFELLTTVNGIGSKSAVNILGVASLDELAVAINEGNWDVLTKASGIGTKTAQRIVLELKGKVAALPEVAYKGIKTAMETNADLEEALLQMGYKRNDVRVILSKIDGNITRIEDRFKHALRLLKK